MARQDVTLADRYDLTKRQVLLNGTQALVRLMLMQAARDKADGLNTAGYVTGYRGSPLGAVDMQMSRAQKQLDAAQVTFQPGLNEDLAATALWGTQQSELRGEGRYDGVFGLWYGKGPGVDRTGDVFRHVNMAGTSKHGGVLVAMGDDHTGESSTTVHQSEWTMVDSMMPVLSPAGVQEIMDLGLFGYAMGRFAGVWAGLKCMKDTVESTAVVNGDPHRLKFVTPEFEMPEGGLNIRLIDHWVAQEERIMRYKRQAAEAFARANRMDKRVWGKPGAKIGFVAAGKNWLDLQHALGLLGIDGDRAEALGITTYKVAMTWPLDVESYREWAEGLDLIVVVEEKRKLLEVQMKEFIFNDRQGRRVYGEFGGNGDYLFPSWGSIDPVDAARKIGRILEIEGRGSEELSARLGKLDAAVRADNAPELAARLPYFCSGCPHNISTKVPEGSRAYAGIGCHFMVQWMDRDTQGFTQMGGEGANWVGEAPFSTRDHVFQNIGDGTYNHSGVQAIRAALMAGTNVTYKILFNDAVAMTGGQKNDGDLTAQQICRELVAMGVPEVHLVYDPKEDPDLSEFPANVQKSTRDQLISVEEKLQKVKGVSAIVYAQTCAAEKRRRRKRGQFPDPDKRVFINTDICEGCGDCGVQSNCVSIVPVETPLGRKRAIDQSSCNKDFSCVDGFCPSFVTIEGAKMRKAPTASVDIPDMPEPVLPEINGTHNVVITGVGGTGVVTIGAVMAMAAHIDGKGAGMMEMAGLAQKGGAVHIHCRLAETPSDISAIRVATGECDVLIGGDLVVSAGAKTLGLTSTGRTGAVVNSHEIITGDFTRNTEFTIPTEDLKLSLAARLQDRFSTFDASALARKLLGDSIFSNMMIFGAAWQQGFLPLSKEGIIRAIELNGAAAEKNIQAFELGRWAAYDAQSVETLLAAEVVALPSADDPFSAREANLRAWGGKAAVRKWRKLVDSIEDADLKAAVAKGYHKLIAYKDEYEVARLLQSTADKAAEEFDGDLKLTYHLAPPFLPGKAANGRPKKREFGSWMARVSDGLTKLRVLRGTPFDPFGYSAERKMERALVREYRADILAVKDKLTPETRDAILALAELPLQIRGFGPVKEANAKAAAKRREELKAVIDAGGPELSAAAE
ncbi:indolepyruvate ferredoxin oxidoreductase family protein [Shimia ponticola]|uniref:indolepyruvate ferredoxin oxidoreductase family protein n=1 Tax=Shimia ponticola TaxID=2582893 RepID=UPI0011BE8DA3|nr:indolepyruvate ferredoxin oxidoreductase family protein [Shimia ponticola]